MPIPFWTGHYIGLPFLEKGRDPKKGLDCWGLVRLVLDEQFSQALPSYTEFYDGCENEKQIGVLVKEKTSTWLSIDPGQEQCGDLIVLRMRGAPMHVGLVVGDQTMLHIEKGINSILARYKTLRWNRRIVGFFRYQNV